MPDDPTVDTEHGSAAPAGTDATVPMLTAHAIGIGVFLGACALCLPIYLACWGPFPLLRGAIRFTHLWETVPLLIALVVAHELLHALGFLVFGRVERRAIRFGIQWKTITPYAHCGVPVTARVYRAAVALPGLLLGILPCIIALTFGSGWLLIWGALMTMAAGGDAAILWAVRSVPGPLLVSDHPTRAGCMVIAAGSVSNPSATNIE
jgi:hypothetical protein